MLITIKVLWSGISGLIIKTQHRISHLLVQSTPVNQIIKKPWFWNGRRENRPRMWRSAVRRSHPSRASHSYRIFKSKGHLFFFYMALFLPCKTQWQFHYDHLFSQSESQLLHGQWTRTVCCVSVDQRWQRGGIVSQGQSFRNAPQPRDGVWSLISRTPATRALVSQC